MGTDNELRHRDHCSRGMRSLRTTEFRSSGARLSTPASHQRQSGGVSASQPHDTW